MSLDLIKKQKADIQKEKRKIAESAEFDRHPLAYQPTPKGREVAVKEHIKSSGRGALDMAGKIRKKPPGEFKIFPDRNSASLLVSRLKPTTSGRRGKHVSDVFVPRSSLLSHKKSFTDAAPKNKVNFQGISSYPSYPGYREKAALKIKIQSDRDEIKKRLGEEENALPDYSREDILGLAASDPRETNDYATNNNFLPKNFNPYGTTVKLSFTKAEKEKENLEFRSTKLEPETKNVERNSKSQILNSKNDNSEQVVAEEEEVLTTNIINDYIPVYTPPALPVQRKQVRPKIFPKPFLSQKIQKPFEKLWQKIKDRSLFSRQSSQIANVEIADNRELADYQTEYRIETSDLSPPPTQPNLSDSLNPPAPLNQPNNLRRRGLV